MDKRTGRIMIAAPSSAGGKTTFTCGLLKCLKDMGLDPVSYKCGPDYIDPMFHREVLEIGSRNLDSYLMSEVQIDRSLAAAGGRPAVIEGVMGLYDGIRVDDISGSSYEIARMTHTPVILCVDARGAGRTLISIIRGILTDDTDRLIRGIVLNRISAGFYERIRPVMERELKDAGYESVRMLGFIPKSEDIGFDSRHLGLRIPGEISDVRERISKAAVLIDENVDVEGILKIMGESGMDLASGETAGPGRSDTSDGPILAVARDEAFCFYYPDNMEILERAGVKIRYFSPIHDEHIPEDASGLLFGGGYPEMYLDELSRNRSMLDSVYDAISDGMPSLAECGGFMYLHRAVSDRDTGAEYSLAGIIDGECRYTGHLVRFGYMYIKSAGSPGLVSAACGMRGHEFHYYESTENGDAAVAAKPSGAQWDCMISDEVSMWGFPHFYYGSKPGFADAFADSMRGYERRRG